ncbi:MAG: flagellar basal body P-ring protein FlgI [Deltaproteobacteria bacterium]
MGNGRRQFLCWMLTVTLAGCQKLSLRSQNPDDDDVKPPETQFIKDQVTVSGLHPITIESVGLVTNLDNTGGDPSPSMYRSLLVNDMKKRGITNPHTLLQSPRNALVLIRAAVPPVIDVGDRFDVEIVLPENGEATSLKGGWLMEAYLSEQAMVPGGQPHPGHALAKAEGPIMLSTGEGGSDSIASGLKRGRILGGGKYIGGLTRKGRSLGLYVRSDLRSVRTTRKIADHVGKRFHYHEHGIKKPLATAKTDQHIELKVHPRYKENYIRYIHVIRNIALDETGPERKERMERLRKSLMLPQAAMQSATELEAIGPDSIVILKEGLASSDPEVRYYSADALAYLGDGAGTQVLADAARNEPAFRIFALTALTTLGTPEARECLIDLMVRPGREVVDGVEQEVSSAETRYGAFRALWTIDKRDEFIGGENINDEFKLHVIPAAGEPMVHLTRFRVPEVVVFGKDQRLSTPINLTAGRHIMISAPSGSESVTVSRLHAHDDDDQEIVTTTRLADVIRAVGKLKAAYPDVAQMLMQAEKQSSLPGRLEIDALPQAGRIYYRTAAAERGGARQEVKVGSPSAVPNMFPVPQSVPESSLKPFHTDADEARAGGDDRGEASLVDVREGEDEEKKPARGGFLGLFRSRNDSQ